MSNGRLRTVVVSLAAVAAVAASSVGVGVSSASAAAPFTDAVSATPLAGWVPNDGVHALAQDANWIYLGGNFTALTNPTTQVTVAAAGLARLDINTGALDPSWTPSVDGDIRTMVIDPSHSTLYLGGDFTQVDGSARARLGAVSTADSGSLSAWNPGGADAEVKTLIQLDSTTLMAGGEFNFVGTHRLEHLAEISTAGVVNGSFHPTIGGAVYNVNHPAGASFVYIGGTFTKLGGQTRMYVGALDITSGQPTSWAPDDPCGTSTEVCPVFAFIPTATAIYASAGGPGGRVMSYNPTTAARKWVVTSDGDDQAMALIGNELFIGGHFGPRWGATVRQTLASVNATTGQTTDWAPHAYDYYPGTWALMVLPNQSLAVGGDQRGFGSIGGHYTVFPANVPNVPPTAAFTSSCTAGACTFDGSGSIDTDGTIASYSWDFGDGTSGTGVSPTHQYATTGSESVTLTVTDNLGATNSTTSTIAVTVAPNPIAYVGSTSAADGQTSTKSVAVPTGAQSGDELLMWLTASTGSGWTDPPSGWTQQATSSSGSVTSTLWTKTASSTDLGSTVTLTTNASGGALGSLTMAAYHGVDGTSLVVTKKGDTNTSIHTAASVSSHTGDWIVSYWGDKSTGTTDWGISSSARARQSHIDGSNPGFSSLIADSGPVPAGTTGGLTATSGVAGSATEMFTVSLPQSTSGVAATGPGGSVTATPVTLYATVDSFVTVTATLQPGDESQFVHGAKVELSASVTRSTSSWSDTLSTATMTSTDGLHWTASVRVPRNASPGSWTAKVVATDSAGTSRSTSAAFPVVQNTRMSIGFSPSSPRAGGTVVLSGTLQTLQPKPSSSSSVHGSYVAYPSKTFVLTGPRLPAGGVTVKTNSKGDFSYKTVVWETAPWTASFGGTSYRAKSTAATTVKVIRNSTRFVSYQADTSALSKSGYITISGTLERNDPNGSDWILYGGKTIDVYLNTAGTSQVTAVTNTSGQFSVRIHGTATTLAGSWYAAFVGTPYNTPAVTTAAKVS